MKQRQGPPRLVLQRFTLLLTLPLLRLRKVIDRLVQGLTPLTKITQPNTPIQHEVEALQTLPVPLHPIRYPRIDANAQVIRKTSFQHPLSTVDFPLVPDLYYSAFVVGL